MSPWPFSVAADLAGAPVVGAGELPHSCETSFPPWESTAAQGSRVRGLSVRRAVLEEGARCCWGGLWTPSQHSQETPLSGLGAAGAEEACGPF